MKLYEITGEILKMYEVLGENTNYEQIKDTLDSMGISLEEKVEGTVKIMKSLEAEAKAFKEEEDRLKERRKTIENQAEFLKNYLDHNLKVANIDKLKAGTFTVSFRNTPPSVNVSDGAEIPSHFYIPQEPKLDKKNLSKWLKDGNELEGVSLETRKVLSVR